MRQGEAARVLNVFILWRGAAIYRMAARGSTSVGLHAEIFNQLHHNRYIRRSS